jgi:hypothetical protein
MVYKGYLGANAGIYLDLKLGEAVKLSLQPSYSQEGTRVLFDVPGEEELVDSIKIRLNYISLPLLVKVATANNRWYALTGVETGYLVDSFLKRGDDKEDVQIDLATINVAIHFGAGFRIPLKFGGLFLELRYTQGLINITDEPLDTGYIPRVKNAGFKLFAGYEIPLSRKEK